MKLIRLVRIRRSRTRDADVMISEFEMRPGKLIFRHVAGDAVLLTDRAGWRGPGGGKFERFAASPMAGQAFGVVKRRVSAHFMVRIVARKATDATIGGVKAAA